jgi:hypothetical protein
MCQCPFILVKTTVGLNFKMGVLVNYVENHIKYSNKWTLMVVYRRIRREVWINVVNLKVDINIK